MALKRNWDFFRKSTVYEENTLIGKILKIGNTATNQKDWLQTATQCSDELSELADYLNTNEFQTAFFAAVFFNTYFLGLDETDFSQIQKFFQAEQLAFMKHKKEILKMQDAGLLLIKDHYSAGFRRSNFLTDETKGRFLENLFEIPDCVVDAMLEGKPLKREKPVKTAKDFLLKLEKISRKFSLSETDEMFQELRDFEIECTPLLEGVKKARTKIEDYIERWLFYFICYDTLFSRDGDCFLIKHIEKLVGEPGPSIDLLKDLIQSAITDDDANKNTLVKEELIEVVEGRIAQDATASATNKGIELLFGKEAELYKIKSDTRNLIFAEKIIEKELFFSEETQTQLERIGNAIKKENFNSLQNRLQQKGMTQGIAALFYGTPGTGKTESVFQLARKTGRDIYHVDISQTKTMWYGESPRLVKKIFKRYKEFCKKAKSENKEIPILLFNEADAVISKRAEITSNTQETDKETNTIQNIVLEEMEKLEGIMIATTNLETNMDNAFERRFLFKVQFHKPDAQNRAKIWRSKIKSLDNDSALQIASDYDFSGGEIDNISRKAELEEVISGIQTDIDKIREFCRTEKINSEDNHIIGFGGQQ